MTIRFVLVQNRQGKARLEKWYASYTEDEKSKLKAEVHRVISLRDSKSQSNFVEFRNYELVYRRYAGLYFTLCISPSPNAPQLGVNELAYLEAIHLFVEVLDEFFGNVCELDLLFNFWKVYAILDEIFLAGEMCETSKRNIIQRLTSLEKLD
ncbi:hypothetical protein MP228_000343 [Amoeboaphelidium protococcarum]|nr:hypothetical protein MP228_000343 [Amoeboaphelidium protococcarum]